MFLSYLFFISLKKFSLLFISYKHACSVQFSSVTQSCPTLCDPMNCSMPGPPRTPTPGVHSNSRPSSRWYHPAISSSVVPFSSCPQSLLASESFPMSQLFAWGGQSIGVSALASVLPKNTQDWSPLKWTGWISLQSKGLSRVFSNNKWQTWYGNSGYFGRQIIQMKFTYTPECCCTVVKQSLPISFCRIC